MPLLLAEWLIGWVALLTRRLLVNPMTATDEPLNQTLILNSTDAFSDRNLSLEVTLDKNHLLIEHM